MTNPLNTSVNKVTWPAMANAALLLVNGRLPEPYMLSETEIGLVMIILTGVLTYFVSNRSDEPATAPASRTVPA